MAEKRQGRKWRVTGWVTKTGKIARISEKAVEIDSEASLERAEEALRRELHEYVVRTFKRDVKDVRIEVESDLE